MANAAVTERHGPSPHVGVVPGVVRSTASMLREPLEFITRISKEHGDVVKFRLAAREVYLFNHPDAIDDLVIGHKDLLVKDWLTRELSLVVGQGLLISEGALWKKQRKKSRRICTASTRSIIPSFRAAALVFGSI